MKVLEMHATNIHEARWRIDILRIELNNMYVKQIRNNSQKRILHCLLEGPDGVDNMTPEGEIDVDYCKMTMSEPISSFGRRALLEIIGILHGNITASALE